jgi:hypothetical protein
MYLPTFRNSLLFVSSPCKHACWRVKYSSIKRHYRRQTFTKRYEVLSPSFEPSAPLWVLQWRKCVVTSRGQSLKWQHTAFLPNWFISANWMTRSSVGRSVLIHYLHSHVIRKAVKGKLGVVLSVDWRYNIASAYMLGSLNFMFADRASWYSMQWKPTRWTIYLQFISSMNLTRFEQVYCPSSGGIHCICTCIGTCYTFKLTGCWPGQDGTQVEVDWRNKLKINSASFWFSSQHVF